LLRPFYSRDRQYWKVVLLCFTAATTFWLLNALNKTYTNIRTTYPLEFVYNKEKYIPLNPLPEKVEINVSGKGWKLLRKSLMLDVRPAEILIQSLPRQDFLTGPDLRPSVASVLDGLQLNFIFTDTIEFKFDRRIRRKIPLVVDSAGIVTAPNAFIASPILVTPDSVLFDGPASIVGKLPSPFPIKLPVSNLDRSFKRFVPVDYPHKSLVSASISDVEVSFAVSPLTWQEVSLRPGRQHFPDTLQVQSEPAAVTVRYGFAPGNAARISPEQFAAALDFTQYNPKDSTVAVVVTVKPAVVKKVVVEPKRVKLKPLL
jgi:hypothetical protein